MWPWRAPRWTLALSPAPYPAYLPQVAQVWKAPGRAPEPMREQALLSGVAPPCSAGCPQARARQSQPVCPTSSESELGQMGQVWLLHSITGDTEAWRGSIRDSGMEGKESRLERQTDIHSSFHPPIHPSAHSTNPSGEAATCQALHVR